MRDIIIVCEIGRCVGWGHLARSAILEERLKDSFNVKMFVVDRENLFPDGSSYGIEAPWGTCDILVCDGLELMADVANVQVNLATISLSFVSDINSSCDKIFAPALHGMKLSSELLDKTITDLDGLLFRAIELPDETLWDQERPAICLKSGGGSDTYFDRIRSLVQERFNSFEIFNFSSEADLAYCDKQSKFMREKLIDKIGIDQYRLEKIPSLAICQGGISALELVAAKIPTIIIPRPDFPTAYRFLEKNNPDFCREAAIENIVSTASAMLESDRSSSDFGENTVQNMREKSRRFWTSNFFEIMENRYVR